MPPIDVHPQGHCQMNNQFHRQLSKAFVPLRGVLEAESGEGNGEDRILAHPGTAENTKHRKNRARNGHRDGSRSMTSQAKDRTETAAEMDAVRGMAMSSLLEDWG